MRLIDTVYNFQNIAPGFAMQPDRADMDRRRIEGEIPFFLDRLQVCSKNILQLNIDSKSELKFYLMCWGLGTSP